MKLHPLHPASVHAPLACIALTPLADLGACTLHRAELWAVSAWLSAGAVAFGLIAATFGAMDFERAYAKAAKTVSWHAVLMVSAVLSAGASAMGRFGPGFDLLSPPAPWAIGVGVLALALVAPGGFLGGELVYRHGVNVDRSP